MITPAYLRSWRESLGVNRETVAAFSSPSAKQTMIRDLERPGVQRWYQWHVDALQQIEDWFNHYGAATEEVIWSTSLDGTIDNRPVLWIYGQESFEWSGLSEICLGYSDLYNVCRLNVRQAFIDEGRGVIDAEFVPKAYDAFRERINTKADHPELRAKWWRHFSQTYKQYHEVSNV